MGLGRVCGARTCTWGQDTCETRYNLGCVCRAKTCDTHDTCYNLRYVCRAKTRMGHTCDNLGCTCKAKTHGTHVTAGNTRVRVKTHM